MNNPVVRPRALRPGDTIAIVAPAGPVTQRDDFYRGAAALERMGFRVRYEDRIFQVLRYLAGTDGDRAGELMRAFENPEIKAIVSLRGGYGCARLIPLLDTDHLAGRCKIFMGFSDLTTLHLFFRRRCGWLTFHGPMATSTALANIGVEAERHLFSLWTDPDYLPVYAFPELESWVPGVAEGELTGGCLSLIAASLGTPYELDTKEKILFVEDLGEPPYRIDRMLTQLRLAGKLQGVAGLLLGSFQDCEPTGEPYTLEESLRDVLAGLQVPVIAKFPSGHGTDNWALPLGTRVRLDATARCLQCLSSSVER